MILFKQFLYRVVQGALYPEVITLPVFGKDGNRDCALPNRYNTFIAGAADDLGDGLTDPGQFFGEQLLVSFDNGFKLRRGIGHTIT